MNINGSKLDQDYLFLFDYDNIEIFVQDENSNMDFKNDFFFFEKEKNYQINLKFSKINESQYLDYYFTLLIIFDYNFEELSFGIKNYSNKNYTFLKISYKNTPKISFYKNLNLKK